MLQKPWQTNARVRSAYEAVREKDRPGTQGARSQTAVPALPPARRAACLPMSPPPCAVSVRLCLVGWEEKWGTGDRSMTFGDWMSRSSSSVGPPSSMQPSPPLCSSDSRLPRPTGPLVLTAHPVHRPASVSPEGCRGPSAQRCSGRALWAEVWSSRPLEMGEEEPGMVSALGWG